MTQEQKDFTQTEQTQTASPQDKAQATPEQDVEIEKETQEASVCEDATADAAHAEEVVAEPTVAELQAQIQELQKQLGEVRLRAQADNENFRKRLEREHHDHIKYTAQKVMEDIIPSIDNLELAINYGSKEEVCQQMLDGITMTRQLLLDAVAKHGLVRLGTEGEAFDPNIHQAVGVDSMPDVATDTVTCVLQYGYALNGRVVRAAMVRVNKL